MKYCLPVELIQSILDTISPCDKAIISNLSLVSSELCAIAQPYLFRKCSFVLNKITPVVQILHPNLPGHHTLVGLPISRASKFLEIARQSPHLFGYIRSIEVKAEESLHDEPDVEDTPTTHIDHSGIALTEILLKALNVQELLFPRDGAPFRWSALPRGLSDTILSIGPRLISLDLVSVENGSFSVELFLKFPNLKRLIVASAIQGSRALESNPDLKRISLQYLEIGQAYVQDEQLRWLHEELNITQLRELCVRGTLMDINGLFCSHHLTRLEWNQRYFGSCSAILF
ncbi:hypothetical protein BJ165DRAFT_1494816 [Panaeolus papilionaceus]|nr:hypothetical protein BJ165DRAFT_1494816 [Panaeolus papilionaceus]